MKIKLNELRHIIREEVERFRSLNEDTCPCGIERADCTYHKRELHGYEQPGLRMSSFACPECGQEECDCNFVDEDQEMRDEIISAWYEQTTDSPSEVAKDPMEYSRIVSAVADELGSEPRHVADILEEID